MVTPMMPVLKQPLATVHSICELRARAGVCSEFAGLLYMIRLEI